jgi:type IV secretion system protein VirB10
VTVSPGTHIPLTLLNSVGTKNSVEGDRVYLQTAYPIIVDGRITIPPGSYVIGTLTHLKRPGRVKGRGELYLRFDSLTLPNGVVRDFRARLSNVDAGADEKVEKTEGMVQGGGNVGGDAKTIGEATAAGAAVGVLAGSASKAAGMGAAAGASAGALVGVLGVLLSRGPDALLAQGSTIEMVLDRPVTFQSSELDFSATQNSQMKGPPAPPPPPRKDPAPSRSRFPL